MATCWHVSVESGPCETPATCHVFDHGYPVATGWASCEAHRDELADGLAHDDRLGRRGRDFPVPCHVCGARPNGRRTVHLVITDGTYKASLCESAGCRSWYMIDDMVFADLGDD